MTQDDQKKQVAKAAFEYIKHIPIIGVGTGSTVNYFIDLLQDIKAQLDGAISSSEASTQRMKKLGIPVIDFSTVAEVEIYIDGADEINPQKQLIKGGGGALTREKVIATASKKFVCIADASKSVKILGNFPLPIEVIPMARSFVAREIIKLGGLPEWRADFITDNGNQIIDVRNLDIIRPVAMERAINDIPGVVSVGIFALRAADIVLLAGDHGVQTIQ